MRIVVPVLLLYVALLLVVVSVQRSHAQMNPIFTGENGQTFSGRPNGGMANGISGGGVNNIGQPEREANGGNGRVNIKATATPTAVPTNTPAPTNTPTPTNTPAPTPT